MEERKNDKGNRLVTVRPRKNTNVIHILPAEPSWTWDNMTLISDPRVNRLQEPPILTLQLLD